MQDNHKADTKPENITVSLSKEEKKALRQAALDNDMSVSELIRKWIKDYKDSQRNREYRDAKGAGE